jgi:hypothetical protein
MSSVNKIFGQSDIEESSDDTLSLPSIDPSPRVFVLMARNTRTAQCMPVAVYESGADAVQDAAFLRMGKLMFAVAPDERDLEHYIVEVPMTEDVGGQFQ